jgi:putative thiamine transport system ATP-binding protein
LLLDEPFSRLDKTLRTAFRAWVFATVRARKIPVILVTHDEEDIPPDGEVIQLSRWQ